MRIIVTLLTFLAVLGMIQNSNAQAVFIWDDISDKEFTLWAQNNLPCPVYLKAEPDSIDTKFERFVPKGRKDRLIQLPIDSLDSPAEFKGQIRYHLTLGNPDAIHDSSYKYLLPYPLGKSHTLIQGNNSAFTHNLPNSKYAFDFDMPKNSLISAARGGTVGFVSANNKEGGDKEDYLKQANKIMICHDDGTVGVYAHLRYKGAIVNIGEKVYAGEIIGFSGNTGYSTTPHLHFVVLAGSKSVPVKFTELPDTLKSGFSYGQNLNF
ncbi:M23 family metallopeptidase [Fodinibius sp.]|uniref:M23 family metallopeptidase n=1 Tax=Fodinibius sp. TaxID=1872440 RepID=UPI002ACD7665|nr:M23 family metallopeptidase [Fodinibius sp.]MDZ7659629.1 M23 family metallopeptidase [Fodinibius sp.]